MPIRVTGPLTSWNRVEDGYLPNRLAGVSPPAFVSSTRILRAVVIDHYLDSETAYLTVRSTTARPELWHTETNQLPLSRNPFQSRPPMWRVRRCDTVSWGQTTCKVS